MNYRHLNQGLGYLFDIVALHVRCYVYDKVLVLMVVVVAAPKQLNQFHKIRLVSNACREMYSKKLTFGKCPFVSLPFARFNKAGLFNFNAPRACSCK